MVDDLPSQATMFISGNEVKRILYIKLSDLALFICSIMMVCSTQRVLAEIGANKSLDKVATIAKAAEPAQPSNPGDKKPYAKEAVEHYNRGIDLHEGGFLPQAVAEYKAAIDADPRMEEAYSNLGLIYAAQHSYGKAKDAFTQALALKPNRPTTLNGLGTVLYAQKKFDEAKDKWLQAITIDPNFASAYYNIGNACEGEGKLEDAKKAFVQAIGVNPNEGGAYYRVGVVMYKQHHYAQAGALLRRGIALAPAGEFINDARRVLKNIDHEFERVELDHPNQKNSLLSR